MKHTAIYYFRKRELKKRIEKKRHLINSYFVLLPLMISLLYVIVLFQNGFMLNCTCINIMSTFKGQKHGLDTHCIRFRFFNLS